MVGHILQHSVTFGSNDVAHSQQRSDAGWGDHCAQKTVTIGDYRGVYLRLSDRILFIPGREE